MTRRHGSGGYVYPLPKSEWTTSRTDQGVDFVNKSAGSRILAIGRSKILSTGAPGWPGGGGVLYELLDGPRKGQVVYAYENVSPHVKPGQIVQAGQTIATMKGTGYPWLEMGWANRAGEPLSHGEYTEGLETKAGKAFKAFIGSLGASPSSGRSISGFEKSLIAQGKSPAEARKIAKSENLGKGGLGLPGEEAFENLPNPVEGIAGLVHAFEAVEHALENPETLLLNVALVGGGAFLVYYGAALMLGVRKPVAGPAQAVAP